MVVDWIFGLRLPLSISSIRQLGQSESINIQAFEYILPQPRQINCFPLNIACLFCMAFDGVAERFIK